MGRHTEAFRIAPYCAEKTFVYIPYTSLYVEAKQKHEKMNLQYICHKLDKRIKVRKNLLQAHGDYLEITGFF